MENLLSERDNLLHVQNELIDSQLENKKLSEELGSLEEIINKERKIQMDAFANKPGLFLY